MRRLIVGATALALMASGWAARGDVQPGTATAPYDSWSSYGGCSGGTGTCDGVTTADPDTGRLQNSWTLTSNGEPIYSVHDVMLMGHVTLDAPAGAVVLTYHLHLDEASAQGQSAGVQLVLGAWHEACAGSGCMTTTYEPLASTSDGDVFRTNEDLVRTVRLVNQGGGNLPAGTIHFDAELYGGADASGGGSSAFVSDVTLTSVDAADEPPVAEPPPPQGPQHIVVTRPYIGSWVPGTSPCTRVLTTQPAVGGACFRVPPGAVAVRATIGDAVNDPVGGYLNVNGGNLAFCGTTPRMPLSLGTQEVGVLVAGPTSSTCGLTQIGTLGVITVDFEMQYPVTVVVPV